MLQFTLPPLPYEYEALKPTISEETLRYHHDKHHLAYVNNLNKLIKGTEFEDAKLIDIVRHAKGAIFNNAAQVWNHTFFFESLTPVRNPMPAELKDENGKDKELLREKAAIRLYGDRITLDEGTAQELVFRFEDTLAFTVLGKNKVNIYFGEELFQLKGDKRFNGLKYVNLFYRHKNIVKGNENVEFLGL